MLSEPSSLPDDISLQAVAKCHRELLESTWHGPAAVARLIRRENVEAIIKRSKALISEEDTLVEFFVPESIPVVVVGDTHGQVHDVLHMLELTDAYSGNTAYVFNGDYVDRGSWGLEVLLAVLLLKAALPKQVVLLRGNHESSLCTRFYGFQQEIRAKYPEWGRRTHPLIAAFLDLFTCLPLGARIGRGTLVVHGGLWRKWPAPKHRKRAHKKPRVARLPEQEPPVDTRPFWGDGFEMGTLFDLRRSSKGGRDPQGQAAHLQVATDLLWSDPVATAGVRVNTARQIGVMFGPDVTDWFLQENGLRLIVRSHEGPDARLDREDMTPMTTGFAEDHVCEHGRLVTVFSAPDYPQFTAPDVDRSRNTASVLKLRPPDYVDFDVVNFAAQARPEACACYYELDLPGSDCELPCDAAPEGDPEGAQGADGEAAEDATRNGGGGADEQGDGGCEGGERVRKVAAGVASGDQAGHSNGVSAKGETEVATGGAGAEGDSEETDTGVARAAVEPAASTAASRPDRQEVTVE